MFVLKDNIVNTISQQTNITKPRWNYNAKNLVDPAIWRDLKETDDLLHELKWFLEEMNLLRVYDSNHFLFRLKESLKRILARYVWKSWCDGRNLMDDLDSPPLAEIQRRSTVGKRLFDILRIQWRNTVRNETFQSLDWYSAELMTDQFVVHSVNFMHGTIVYETLRFALTRMFDEWSDDPAKESFHVAIERMREKCEWVFETQAYDYRNDYGSDRGDTNHPLLFRQMLFLQAMVRSVRAMSRWVLCVDRYLRIGALLHRLNEVGTLEDGQTPEDHHVAIVYEGAMSEQSEFQSSFYKGFISEITLIINGHRDFEIVTSVF